MVDPLRDEDLLKPTLRPVHDAAGIGQPFDPKKVVFASFFCGPIGGGWLAVRNFRELGLHHLVRPWTAAFAALTLAMAVGGGWIVSELQRPSAPAALRSREVRESATRARPARERRSDDQQRPSAKKDPADARTVFRASFQMATILVCGAAARLQRTRFRVFTAQGGRATPILGPAVLVTLIGLPVYIGALLLCSALWRAV